MTNANENSQSPDSEDRLTTGPAKGQASDDDNGSPSPAGDSAETLKDLVVLAKMPREGRSC